MRTLLFTYLQPENNYKSHFSTNSQYKLPSSNLMDRPKFYVIAIVLEVQSMGIILSLLIIEKYLFSPFYVPELQKKNSQSCRRQRNLFRIYGFHLTIWTTVSDRFFSQHAIIDTGSHWLMTLQYLAYKFLFKNFVPSVL